MARLLAIATLVGCCALSAKADDWPQWMGPERDGIWREDGILEKFPKGEGKNPGGPKLLWKQPIHGGYTGPAVADGKVFVMDRVLAKGVKNPDDPFDTKQKINSTERILCFDAKTGKELWHREYECPYQISYPAGPRCTPTVHDGKVYTLGAMGDLYCLDAKNGDVLWSKNFPKDFKSKVPTWGFCGHPLVYKNLLICMVGGEGAAAVAFDKNTGEEKWKALDTSELGYAPPTLIRGGGVDQVVIWHGKSINGLDPQSGKVHWSIGIEPLFAMAIMAPRQSGNKLYAAGIGGAAVLLELEKNEPKVKVLWQEVADKNMNRRPKERGLYPVNMTPFIDGNTVYGVDQPGMMRAMELETGKKLWFTHKPVIDREEAEDFKGSGSGTAFIVKNGDRYFLFAETGDLIIAKLTPEKYEEISRAKLLEPTGAAFGRKVVWSHPAFANKCIFVRNDKEIACYSLAKE